MERTQNLEIGYERVAGSRTYSLGAYDESVSNAAFMLSAPADFLPAAICCRTSVRKAASLTSVPFTGLAIPQA